MEIRQITWEQTKPIWDTYLWPGRDSEPVTSMKYLGGYDMAYKAQEPRFIGIENAQGILVAVNSYVLTHGTEFRSRGLWVDPQFRRLGYAKVLLEYMLDFIATEGGTMVWTMPRRGALEAYESAGFIRTTGWSEEGWGVNCYAIASLRTIASFEEEAERYRERRKRFWTREMSGLQGYSTEEMRRIMKPLADEEEAEWR